ncbi:MAG TPA: 2-hydroxychromene-2-carboxylate isomerase [Usitatibacter sp.]|jgi:2-hydroxychromene-2-carboxylate isomerase|nr:2-hydroxychromene-2-carboxylate isomerase [Usitatibacter sp.]
MSTAPVDFYFEFSSPYGYIASGLVDEVGQRLGREIRWRPFLLGPVFKATGGAPLVDIPMKGEYSRHDFSRSARYHGVPFAIPPKFPIGTVPPVRAFYWQHERDPAQARKLAKDLYGAYFVDGRDIGDAKTVLEVARDSGSDAAALEAALADAGLKERAKAEVDAAIARGVFGSPFFIVDGEPFWGCDRIPMMEAWVKRGGW